MFCSQLRRFFFFFCILIWLKKNQKKSHISWPWKFFWNSNLGVHEENIIGIFSFIYILLLCSNSRTEELWQRQMGQQSLRPSIEKVWQTLLSGPLSRESAEGVKRALIICEVEWNMYPKVAYTKWIEMPELPWYTEQKWSEWVDDGRTAYQPRRVQRTHIALLWSIHWWEELQQLGPLFSLGQKWWQRWLPLKWDP